MLPRLSAAASVTSATGVPPSLLGSYMADHARQHPDILRSNPPGCSRDDVLRSDIGDGRRDRVAKAGPNRGTVPATTRTSRRRAARRPNGDHDRARVGSPQRLKIARRPARGVRDGPSPADFGADPPVRVGHRARRLVVATSARRKVRPGEMMQVILDVVHGPRKGAVVRVRPPRHVHRGAFPVRPLRDAGGLGALARPLPHRGQPAPLRAPRPREHQRDVRQRPAGRPRPAPPRRPDLGRSERLRRPVRGRPGEPGETSRRRGRRPCHSARPALGPLRRLRRPRAAGRRRAATTPTRRRLALRPLPGRGRDDPPARAQLHRHPRAGPRRDGGRLPGPPQPDRPDGRPQADRPRERGDPDGHRPLPPRDVGHQPAQAPQHRRVARAGDDPRPVLVHDGVC